MKTTLLVLTASVACATLALAAEADPSAQFQAYPKNLARQHLGTNLMQFNQTTHMFTPTQAAAAWLDDDITTGWPLMAEKQYYLLSLAKPELITNFALSAKAASGTISLYGSETAAAPGAPSWTPLLKDASIEAMNQKLSRDFSKVAKYVLIETSVSNPGPVYSIYLYSHKPAVSYEVTKRPQAIEPKSVFGPYVNEATAFNASALYAHATVTQSGGASDPAGWQKAIDDNPETSITVPAKSEPTTIRYDRARSISRVALLTDPGTKGKVDLFLGESGASLDSAPPTMTMVLDGSTPRVSVDFPATSASELRMRWTPANGTDALTLREVNSFGDTTLSSYAVNATSGTPAAVADRETVNRSERGSSDGKDTVDAKDPKDAKNLPAVAAGPNGPYLPGALGFPPNTSVFRNIIPPPTPVLPPETPPASQ